MIMSQHTEMPSYFDFVKVYYSESTYDWVIVFSFRRYENRDQFLENMQMFTDACVSINMIGEIFFMKMWIKGPIWINLNQSWFINKHRKNSVSSSKTSSGLQALLLGMSASTLLSLCHIDHWLKFSYSITHCK